MGALLTHLTPNSVHKVYHTLYRLVMQEDLGIGLPIWQVTHGGMLGLKYLSAVRTDLLIKNTELLDGVVRAVMRGLSDTDDDVRAVSAATLIPIAAEFISLRPHAVDGLINVVWECLSHLKDDLSASTGSVMDLLAKLCSFPEVLEAMRHKASTDSSYVTVFWSGGGKATSANVRTDKPSFCWYLDFTHSFDILLQVCGLLFCVPFLHF
jgi:TATA-binding protein-associated factor